MDNSSLFITLLRCFNSPTTENTLPVLNQEFLEYGTPREILIDNGTQFVSARNRKHAHHKFGEFLALHNIRYIPTAIKHPQTDGKIERFFGEIERRIGKFGSVDKIVGHSPNLATKPRVLTA
jgi:putative transposase